LPRTAGCGIDIEKGRPKISDQAIAERFFCANENEWLRSLPPDRRVQGFFRLWSVKESILKADGKGMTIPLSAVDTTSVLEGTSPLVSLLNGSRVVSLWVRELYGVEGYTVAIAVESTAPRIQIIEVAT